MKIEVLYPELSNLYGDYYNAKYLAMCIPDSQTVFTSNNDKPAFLSEKVDIICMGSMSERNQEFAIKHLMPYKDKIKELVENGTFFLATGNSFEIFGKHIEDDDKKIECLGAIDFYSKRQMNDRRNCFFLGDFQTENGEDIKIVGHKSQFSFSHGKATKNPFISVEGGFGINLDSKNEGIHYKNFFGTYILGPFIMLNPKFLKYLLRSMNLNDSLLYEEEINNAYADRLKRLQREGTEFLMGAE